jgi:hypothetical protein
MTMIRTQIKNGRIDIAAPIDLSDGSEVLVEVTPIAGIKIGISEAEWRDDPEALADWSAWIKSLPTSRASDEAPIVDDAFYESFRKLNLEAVRKQMNESAPE